MKTHIYILLFFLLSAFAGIAQTGEAPDLDTKRVGVYTRVLGLTTDEAKRFWPVFNQYQTEVDKITDEEKSLRRSAVRKFNSLTDADVEKLIDEMLNLKQKHLDLLRKYTGEFKRVIPVKKVVLMQKAEREFKKQLLRDYRSNRGGGQSLDD